VISALLQLEGGDVERAPGRLHRLLQKRDLHPALGKGDGGGVHFAGRPQDRVLVLLVQLLEAGVLDQYLICHAAVVEDVPDEAGADTRIECSCRPGQRRAGKTH